MTAAKLQIFIGFLIIVLHRIYVVIYYCAPHLVGVGGVKASMEVEKYLFYFFHRCVGFDFEHDFAYIEQLHTAYRGLIGAENAPAEQFGERLSVDAGCIDERVDVAVLYIDVNYTAERRITVPLPLCKFFGIE